MRCFRVALKFVTSAVPGAALVFVWCSPASAHTHHHSHYYSYRHVHAHGVHYGGRHLYAMYQNGFVPNQGFSSQYFGSPSFGANNFSGSGYAPSARYDNGYARSARYGNVSALASSQASTAGLPASLVERVIRRESGGNPRAVHAGNYGLMQIRLGTARAMGYTGSAAGLLDPQTNMTYALRYLAGAYRAAGGNESRAIALYSRGYYAQAKAQGFSPYASGTTSAPGFASYGAAYQPAYQTSFQSWPNGQNGLRHRRHYHA
jgi:soluble lytic murein transglycosylase-like protein